VSSLAWPDAQLRCSGSGSPIRRCCWQAVRPAPIPIAMAGQVKPSALPGRGRNRGGHPMMNRSAKDGARSSPHYRGKGVLIHPSYQGVCGWHGTEEQRVTSGELVRFPGGTCAAKGHPRDYAYTAVLGPMPTVSAATASVTFCRYEQTGSMIWYGSRLWNCSVKRVEIHKDEIVLCSGLTHSLGLLTAKIRMIQTTE